MLGYLVFQFRGTSCFVAQGLILQVIITDNIHKQGEKNSSMKESIDLMLLSFKQNINLQVLLTCINYTGTLLGR